MVFEHVFKWILREGDHVVVSGMEHNGVMRPLEPEEDEGNFL